MEIMGFKYLRIQGREMAEFTNYANGIFGIFRDFEKKHVMTDEDFDLYQEVVQFFCDELPWPPMCNDKKKVVCFFKVENSDEMLKHMKPLLWLLERYNHPCDVILTNYPGNIIYEDDFQIVVTIDDLIYEDQDMIHHDIFKKLDEKKQDEKKQKIDEKIEETIKKKAPKTPEETAEKDR